MIELTHWWAITFLPLPWALRRILPNYIPSETVFVASIPNTVRQTARRQLLYPISISAAWMLLVVALCRPVWHGEPLATQAEHRDMVLAVDLSASMTVEDMRVTEEGLESRLTLMRRVLSQFISLREGDRVGLTIFADHGYLISPLTLDTLFISEQIDILNVGMAGYMTAIGDGLATAIKLLLDTEAEQRIIILLSDGSNTSGQISPIDAAKLAADQSITVYTIGLGATQLVSTNTYGDTYLTNPSEDLDEELLKNIAKTTGGRYFRAHSSKELQTIYSEIAALEPIKKAEQYLRPKIELFRVPLSVSVSLILFTLIMRRFYG